jgi:o-succinylbenzoate synthase
MQIAYINLFVIKMPLKVPFQTHLGNVAERESIIIEAVDDEGTSGYGECVAFTTPWYTEETVKTCFHMLTDILIPLLQTNPINHPDEAASLFNSVRRNHMAKAGLEMALWDLFAKQSGRSLSSLLGGTLDVIPSGVVVASNSLVTALKQIESYLDEGYLRFKVKISPVNDYSFLSEIRRHFPDLSMMADANSAYTLNHLEQLKALDELDLLMIEQPLGCDDIIEHAALQKELRTPVCLDESIVTLEDAKKAIELGSCKIINIKAGRVGGLKEAKKIHDYCYARGIQVWCGGMIEFGVSRAHNIALASLPGFSIPGDISASSRFWEEDIIFPDVKVNNGFVSVPTTPGIGFEINKKRLKQCIQIEKSIEFS